MKKIILIIMCMCMMYVTDARDRRLELLSPGGKIKVSLDIADRISYSVYDDGELLLRDNTLQLVVDGRKLGEAPRLLNHRRTSADGLITPVVPLKYSEITDRYNSLVLNFKGWSVEFRAYDDGMAYRFITSLKGDVEVSGEVLTLNFPEEYMLHMQQPGSFHTAYEEPYSHVVSTAWNPGDRMATLPMLIDTRKGRKILVSESDLSDYPCMFLSSDGAGGVVSAFPKAPLEFVENGDRSVAITREADYIARTRGTRTYPWRYFVISGDDRQLIENTMTCRLAGKSHVGDTSWIKPGQVSWEWWNDASPYGPDVNFVSGYNLDTYKYYIDFASRFGIPYIIMDEGWAQDTRDPYTPNPRVDLHELIRYGNEKNVGIVLWLTWLTVENNFDLFKTFSDWGVKGVKIDFMDRSDQWMVNFYERVAEEAAKNRLFVDFHGSFKPAGLEYRYPNVLSYEGVRGMEQMGGCRPDNSLYLPFMRNAVGPMDYTPGAMISMQPEVYRSERPNSASIGTRAYQMALFVVFESGLQMLADNPTLYYRNEDCTRFITSVPVTWDETKALEAKAGEYVIVAKRKGDRWFIGGICNGDGDGREFTVPTDFLDNTRDYRMTSFEDGINAGRQAMDYHRNTTALKGGEPLKIRMVRNGGFAAVIE